jgi:hypothetical protein
VTDRSLPGSGSPEMPAANAAQSPAPPPAATQAGKWRPVIIIGGIALFLVVVLFAVRNNVAAGDLKVGDCFNTTSATSVQTLETQPCTESHNAEVFFVGEYTGETYPISLSIERYIEEACVPAFEAYVGRAVDSEPTLSIGYLYPGRDGWEKGDRTVSCYVTQPDESPMTTPIKG